MNARQQEAREDGKDTQEEQSGQTRQGAGRAERNTRHNETFKCAMMVAWTSGRVRAQGDTDEVISLFLRPATAATMAAGRKVLPQGGHECGARKVRYFCL